MVSGCDEILRQGKGVHNSLKLRKAVAIYKTNELVLSKKYLSIKARGSEKVLYSKSSYSRQIFFNHGRIISMLWVTKQILYVSGITLRNDNYIRKNSETIAVRSCSRNHLTLFIWLVRRSAYPCLLYAAFFGKTNRLFCAWMTPIFYRTVC